MEVGHPVGNRGEKQSDRDDELNDPHARAVDERRSEQPAHGAGKDATDEQHGVDLHPELDEENDRFHNRGYRQANEDGWRD